MESPKLSVLFHTNEDKWNSVYHSLFNAPTSRHINIEIKQYQASHGFPAFFYYTALYNFYAASVVTEASLHKA